MQLSLEVEQGAQQDEPGNTNYSIRMYLQRLQNKTQPAWEAGNALPWDWPLWPQPHCLPELSPGVPSSRVLPVTHSHVPSLPLSQLQASSAPPAFSWAYDIMQSLHHTHPIFYNT